MTSNVKPFQPVRGDRKPAAKPLPDLDDDVVQALADVKSNMSDQDTTAGEDTSEGNSAGPLSREDDGATDAEKQRHATPAQQAQAKLEKPTPTSDYEHINIGLPPYLMDQLRLKSIKDRSSVRYEILRGLRRAGYDIRDVDMIKDARRAKVTRRRRR